MGWSRLRRIVLPVLSLALVVSGALSGPVWADPPAESPVGPVVRPDWVSASVTARSLGVRVEVLSERSETAQVWVNPDGSVTQDRICTGGKRLEHIKGGGTTWGDTFVTYSYSLSYLLTTTRGKLLMAHERIHVKQCYSLGKKFAVAYALAVFNSLDKTGHYACMNIYERQANLRWGGYAKVCRKWL